MNRRVLFRMRLLGILRKESLQILRDPSSLILAVVMPIVLLFIFGYGVSLDAKHVPIAVVNHDTGANTRAFTQRLALSSYFEPVFLQSLRQAENTLMSGQVDAVLHLHDEFTNDLLGGHPASVQLIVNGVDANRARQIQGYVRGIIEKWALVQQAKGEQVPVGPVVVEQRIRFNESGESRNFLVPGLMTLIMTLTGTLLTALVVAREWERGTMEAILVTPVRRIDLLLGKVLPYFFLGMLGMIFSVVFGVFLFDVPFRGSVGALLILSSLFMLASLGLGLMISAAVRVQFVAAQISIVVGFLPAFFLSGLLFDLESTPRVIQMISRLVPARYFVSISHTLFLAGNIWDVLRPNAVALAIMAFIFISISYRRMKKHLE
ncbi:MAG: ABC transporter permease [Desulfobacterales bacterium]